LFSRVEAFFGPWQSISLVLHTQPGALGRSKLCRKATWSGKNLRQTFLKDTRKKEEEKKAILPFRQLEDFGIAGPS
jgi:hypothetical protein